MPEFGTKNTLFGIIQTLCNAWGEREASELCYEPLQKLGGGEGSFSNAVT